jgi:hypothetical protein
MAHAQKPDFVFQRNGRVHINRRERKFSGLLAAEVCASVVVMLDTPCYQVVWRALATHSIRQFPLHFPSRASPLCHHVSNAVYRYSQSPTFVHNLFLKTCSNAEIYKTWAADLYVISGGSFWFPSMFAVALQSINNANSPTAAQVNCPKNNFKIYIKLTLKQLQHVSVRSNHRQGVHYLCLLKLQLLK